MLAGHRGRFIIIIALALAASATGTHADPYARPRSIPVYVFAGQSNMVGASAPAEDLPALAPELTGPQRNVLFFGPTNDRATRWSALQAPTEISQSLYGPGFGPELSTAAALSSPDAPIAVVKFAHDGTNLYHDWDPSRSDGLYAAMIARTKLALALLAAQTHAHPRIAAFFWMQGEGDSYRSDHADAYAANLKNFISHLRADLDVPHLRVVLGRIAPIAGPFSGVVRGAQTEIAKQGRDVTIVETSDLPHDPASLVHLNSSGELALGRRFARALAP